MIGFEALVAECAPNVAPSTLRAMSYVESSFNPYAIGVVNGRLIRQPKSHAEAIATTKSLQSQGVLFSAGLLQIFVKNWAALGLDHETVFDPCTNMRASAKILGDCYARALAAEPKPQMALRHAFSCYYSNNFVTGYRHGYVDAILSAAKKFAPANQRAVLSPRFN